MIEEIPRSPSSVRSWRSLSPRARSKVYIEEDMDGHKPHNNIHNSIYQSEHPQDIEDDHTQLSEPSGTPVETHIRGTNGRLLQPPKTPPKIAECVLPSDEHMNLTDRIPFDKEYAVDLSIEEAVGLPLTASYTRIQAKLHMPTRNDVRDTSNFCYADVLSEYTSPKFTFTTRFRGKLLFIFVFEMNFSYHPYIVVAVVVYRQNASSNDDHYHSSGYIRSPRDGTQNHWICCHPAVCQSNWDATLIRNLIRWQTIMLL